MTTTTPFVTYFYAALFVLSGVCQPLIMTLCKSAGLADSTAQIYMFFYYLGPALIIFTVISQPWPPRAAIMKASGIAVCDIVAQALNYTGGGLAGSTIFAVIYSSVTVWTAVWSRVLLGRSLSVTQWLAVMIVFGGLTLTTLHSADLGHDIKLGAVLIIFGSALHAGSYVLSEAVLSHDEHKLSISQNTGIQAVVATVALGVWQLIYTVPRWQSVVVKPTQMAGTTLWASLSIMGGFALANLVHSLTFYHTLKYYPGGSTSAGVMKGLQAVLVFIATDVLYCGRIGGHELCFSLSKLLSLVTVIGGVILFSVATEKQNEKAGYSKIDDSDVSNTSTENVARSKLDGPSAV